MRLCQSAYLRRYGGRDFSANKIDLKQVILMSVRDKVKQTAKAGKQGGIKKIHRE